MHTSPWKQISFRVFLIVGSLLLLDRTLVAAAPATRIACGQCEETDRFVRLQSVTTATHPADAQRFTHPFTLSPEDWTSILTELRVQRQAEGLLLPEPPGPVTPAFTAEEIRYLSMTLSRAFAQARDNEWVVFGLSRATLQGLTELTTGGWYLEGASLHVVLANYRKVVTMPSTRQLLWERPLRPDAGPSYRLVAGPYQTMVKDSASITSLWASSPSEIAIAYQPLLLGEPVATSPAPEIPAIPQLPEGTSKILPPPVSLEDRLHVLQRLRAHGLITEEEYRVKKQQLLDRF